MPASFLSRHRTICEVLEDIKVIAAQHEDKKLLSLAIEAKQYAEAMSAKLAEYKSQSRPTGDLDDWN